MKWLITWILIIAVTGCQTMRPIEGGPSALQERINSGDLLKPGDRVWIVTSDEKAHRFVTGNTGGLDVFCGSSFTTAKFATTNIGGGTTNCVEPSP